MCEVVALAKEMGRGKGRGLKGALMMGLWYVVLLLAGCVLLLLLVLLLLPPVAVVGLLLLLVVAVVLREDGCECGGGTAGIVYKLAAADDDP